MTSRWTDPGASSRGTPLAALARAVTPGGGTTPGGTTDRIGVPTVHRHIEPPERVMKRARNRSWFMASLFGIGLAAIGVRAGWLCVSPAPQTIALGSQQRWEQMTLEARRGSIYDRDGHRLVVSVDTPNVIVDPAFVPEEDVEALSARVASILDLDPDTVATKMRQRGRRYAKLASKVHPKLANEVMQIKHKALFIESGQRRFYGEESLASHLTGYVDGRGKGVAGLEHSMNDVLRGSTVLLQRRRDRRGLDVERLSEVDRASSAGMDIHLTIDRNIQRATERALAGVEERHRPAATMAVVVDVKTGDILALANTPTYNPNAIGNDSSTRRNRVVMDAIEPGSVFKPFTVAAAVDAGKVATSTLVDCENGRWRVGRSRIGDDHPHGVITVSEVIKYSSNIGSAKMALQVGTAPFLAKMREFGFGERTGVELPGERSGYLRSADKIRPIELATTSYGQGATATVLQLAYATATLANGGVRMKPRLVTRVIDEDGVAALINEPEPWGRVVSEATARDVAAAMVTVTEPGGTATRARIPGYEVAGKTGTAWKVEGGKYTDARIGSFIGFVPADRPEVAIVVVVDDPQKGGSYGGVVAAPAFTEIATEAMRTLGVPPDSDYLHENDGELVATNLPAQVQPAEQAHESGMWTLPDLEGATMRQALGSLEGTGLAVEVHGTGRLAAMEPPPGVDVFPGTKIKLTFQ